MTCEIDFLPVTYLEAGAHRKNVTLRFVFVGLFAAMLAFALLYQQHLRQRAEKQLAELMPEYYRAMADSKQLSSLQAQVKTARKQAELYAYLDHPWPRSRIVSALSESLPDEIELERIDVAREPIPGRWNNLIRRRPIRRARPRRRSSRPSTIFRCCVTSGINRRWWSTSLELPKIRRFCITTWSSLAESHCSNEWI